MLSFQNASSLFKTFSSIQFGNLFETKTERAIAKKQILETGESPVTWRV